jgi:spermidine synthase
MGGTLPVLGRFVIRDLERLTRSLGVLYGLNTLGAAAGVFLAGFYSFEYLGVSRSGYAAALLLGAVGLTALALDAKPSRRADDRGRDVPASAGSPAAERAGLRRVCLFAAGAGGLAVLGYEVAWTRLLSLFMRSFSYSFSLMLALFLVGLALGAATIALVGARLRHPARWLGWIQLAMGGYVALSLLWLPERLAPVSGTSFTGFLLAAASRAALVVLPPTLLSGMALPLAARCVARGVAAVGSDVGRVYSVNTVGAIAGALLTGLVLLPTIGASASLAVLACFQAATGVLVLTQARVAPARLVVAAALAAACALPLATGTERFVDAFLRASLRAETIGELLYFHEGAVDTVAIVRRDYGFRDPEAKSLITNGVAMSATVKPVWRYMALEGHLPVLFARHPRHALAVGVGTGITLGAIVSHPELESITGVELSEGVLGGLRFFEAENGGAWRDPRVRLLHEDGRHHLELTGRRYDVITLEPPPPIVAGSVHLYTLDFYELCRRRSSPGAVVAQWLPLHGQSLASAHMTARTFAAAFPHVMLWLPSVRDAVLIGSDAPLRLDAQRWTAAYANPGTRANLEQAFFETPTALLSTYLLDREGIELWAADAPVVTDERPLIEFFRHQGGNMKDEEIAPLIALPQAERDWLDVGPAMHEELLRENLALRSYVRSSVERDPAPGLEAARLAQSTEFFLYPFGCTTEQLSGLSSTEAAAHGERCRRLRRAPE